MRLNNIDAKIEESPPYDRMYQPGVEARPIDLNPRERVPAGIRFRDHGGHGQHGDGASGWGATWLYIQVVGKPYPRPSVTVYPRS